MASPSEAPRAHRFTREEFTRMGEAGIFRDERVELLDGEVIAMAAQKPPHASAVETLSSRLSRLVGDLFCIRRQLPLALDPWSEPEPDVVVCILRPDGYSAEHPEPADVRLVVEVADGSLAFDRRRKSAAYARAGIRELWIVDVRARQLEVRSEPDPTLATYASVALLDHAEEVEGPGGIRLRVEEFLPVA